MDKKRVVEMKDLNEIGAENPDSDFDFVDDDDENNNGVYNEAFDDDASANHAILLTDIKLSNSSNNMEDNEDEMEEKAASIPAQVIFASAPEKLASFSFSVMCI